MSGRRPLVPPELRELLGLFGQLSELPPLPADSSDIGIVNQVSERRASLVRARLQMLADEFDLADKYPSAAAEGLAKYCSRSIAALRAELAEPLGYEPREAGR